MNEGAACFVTEPSTLTAPRQLHFCLRLFLPDLQQHELTNNKLLYFSYYLG